MTMYLLLAQQQKLEHIALGPVMCNFEALLETRTLPWIKLSRLDLPETVNNSVHECVSYNKIIKNAPHLSGLSIRCKHFLESDPDERVPLSASAENLERVFLDDIETSGSRSQYNLEEVRFGGIRVGGNLISRLNLPLLRILSIRHCQDVDSVLLAIIAAATKGDCALQDFTYIAGDNTEVEFDLLHKMLKSLTGLKKLHLSRHETDEAQQDVFDIKCIDGHKATLESVFIGCAHIIDVDQEEVLEIDPSHFASFQKLRYLAVPMPKTFMPAAGAQASSDYITVFQSLMQLPDIKVLRIINFPKAIANSFQMFNEKYGANHDENSYLDHYNQEYFTKALDSFVKNKLAPCCQGALVLCFGGGEEGGGLAGDGENEVDVHPAYYMMKQHTGILGLTYTSATRTSLSEAWYLEPELRTKNLECHTWLGCPGWLRCGKWAQWPFDA